MTAPSRSRLGKRGVEAAGVTERGGHAPLRLLAVLLVAVLLTGAAALRSE